MPKRFLLGALVALSFATSVDAQSGGSTVRPTWFDGATQYYISTAHPLPVSASVSASISGFPTSQTTGTPISVTTGGVIGSLPTGNVVVATNVGTTNAAYCKLGASATTSDQYIAPSGGWFAFTVGANTQLTCITSTGTTTVNMVGGSGLPTGTGGGGGGSGGGAVTLASGAVASGAYSAGAYAAGAVVAGAFVDGWDVTQGTKADTAWVSGSGSVIALLKNIAGGVAGSIPAGSNVIGGVTVASGGIASGGIAAGAQVDLLTMRGTKAPGTAAANSLLTGGVYNSTAPTLTDGQQASLQLGPRGGLLLGGAGYPSGATPITISATGTTGATTATLATGASVTTYLCGFSIRANATAAATGNSTVTGTITGTLNYTQWTAPNASGIGITEQIFTPCIPASAVNTSIAVISAAPGTGGVVSVTAWGFTL